VRAEAVIERVLSGDRSALGIETGDVPEQAEIEKAAATLDDVWQESLKKETPRYLGAAHNGALAYNILGRRDDARRLLDEALKLPEAGDETKRLRLSLYNPQESLGDANRLADTLSDTPRNAIIRAELRVRQAPSEARTLLERRDTFSNHLDVIGAAYVVVDSYLSEENFDAAMAESERAEVAKLPFYRRSRIALAIRIQDIGAAETEIREYLAESPRNLEMHLQLMHALFRQDKLAELRAEAAKPASGFDGEPLDFVKLAQFKDSFGDWQEAHA
jgi:hypothetical protein